MGFWNWDSRVNWIFSTTDTHSKLTRAECALMPKYRSIHVWGLASLHSWLAVVVNRESNNGGGRWGLRSWGRFRGTGTGSASLSRPELFNGVRHMLNACLHTASTPSTCVRMSDSVDALRLERVLDRQPSTVLFTRISEYAHSEFRVLGRMRVTSVGPGQGVLLGILRLVQALNVHRRHASMHFEKKDPCSGRSLMTTSI